MRTLAILLICTSAVLAQQPPAKPPTPKTRPSANWGGLFSVIIPESCEHPHDMKGKPTCRVYLSFPRGKIPSRRTFFRTWDEAGEEDSSYRILLIEPTPRGIYVQGVQGHRIFVEVTYR